MKPHSRKRVSTPRRTASGLPAPQGPVDYGLLPDLLGYRLKLAQLAVFSGFDRSLGELGVSPGRVGVLVLVEANPGIAQSRLAEAVGLDRSTLVPLLDRFEAAGWLERRPGRDRRTNGLWLTASGKRFAAHVKARVREHESRVAARLTGSERATLIRLLALLQG